MTEASPKVTQLTPEEWKSIVLVNFTQLTNWLQAIPGNTETGASGLTEERIQSIEAHLTRTATLLHGWSKAKLTITEAPKAQAAAPAEQANGAAPPKRRGGWPAGKPRTRQAKAPAVTQ